MRALSGGKSSFVPLVVLSAIAVLVSLGAAEGKRKAKPAPTGLPGQIGDLAKQLPGVMLVDAAPITGQIQKLVTDQLSDWMADRTPSDVEVRRQMENDFSLMQYPAVAYPVAFAQSWKGQTIIGAGYTLGWTDLDRQNVLAIFSSSESKSRLVTVANPVPHIDLHFEPLPQLAWDDLRFFVYGVRLGKSQHRLSVFLYSFDGRVLKSLWENQDIYDGKIDFMKDKVTISYLKEDEYTHAVEGKRVPPRHQTTYQLTPGGIQLTNDHEIPY